MRRSCKSGNCLHCGHHVHNCRANGEGLQDFIIPERTSPGTGSQVVKMPVQKATEDEHWYRYNDIDGVERYACNMATCVLKDKGYKHIGSLNVHMKPEHKLRASKKRQSTPTGPLGQPPCITRSAAKRASRGGATGLNCTPPSAHGACTPGPEHGEDLNGGSSPKRRAFAPRSKVNGQGAGGSATGRDIDGARLRRQMDKDWTDEYKAGQASRNARMAFQDLKASVLKAVGWIEAITVQNEVNKARWTDYKAKQPKGGYTSNGLWDSDSNSDSLPAQRGGVEENNPLSNHFPVHYPAQLSAGSTEIPDNVLIALQPHAASTSRAGGNAAKQRAIFLDMERRKTLCRAIATKLRHPPTFASPASPEMQQKRVHHRPQLALSPILKNQSTAAVLEAELSHEERLPAFDADTAAALSSDILSLEVEENSPIAICKADPKYLLISAKHKVKEVIGINSPESAYTMFDIDHPSPMRPPPGSTARRPIVIKDSPLKTPPADGNQNGAVNLQWESNGRRQTVMVPVPRIKGKKKVESLNEPSPPSAGCHVDQVALPVPPEIGSSFRNLSTQSIEWILDELQFDAELAAKDSSVDGATESLSF